jgi:hypothetical protein
VLEFSRFVIKMGKGVKKYGTGDVYLGGDQVKLFQIQAVGSGTHEIFLFFFLFLLLLLLLLLLFYEAIYKTACCLNVFSTLRTAQIILFFFLFFPFFFSFWLCYALFLMEYFLKITKIMQEFFLDNLGKWDLNSPFLRYKHQKILVELQDSY